ncbi:CD109 antigen [Salarias fasciatus]|uniref:CD109 antigen n=1 Tax=Salarias fasciatus TaxID=181472 RepID=UPI0011765063|nr:CD109 antigen [Salarias fasciatus]
MERLQVWGFLSLFVVTVAQNSSLDPQPSYLLLAPRLLRPGVPTSLSVSILTGSKVTVSAHIVHGNQTLTSNSTEIQGGSTGLLVLQPLQVENSESSDWSPFRLEVYGETDGVQVFRNSTDLRLDPRCLSTLIQTDKLNYLPGQKVKIRAVSIDFSGRPFISPVDIVIRDPRGNMLRQWLDLSGVLGVVSKEFQLSENPPLGQWTILTTVKGISTVKNFVVAQYVLPKFEVVINVPDVIYQQDPLQGSITAKYTYGKPVQGRMSVTFIHHFLGNNEVNTMDKEIDGTEDFSYMVSDEKITSLTIVANVTEHLTGLSYNSTAMVTLAKTKYKVTFDCYPKILRPLGFTARLHISTYDGRPLSPEDQQKMVQVSVTQEKASWVLMGNWRDDMQPQRLNASDSIEMQPPQEEPHHEEMELAVPPDGVIPLNIDIMNQTDVLSIYASFDDSHNYLHLYKSYISPSDSYLQIQKPSSSLEVGSPFILHVDSNFPKMDIHFVVTSKGQVVLAGKSSGDLTLVPDASWAPVACIVIYCVNPSGEIINDVIQLPVKQFLQNQVSLNWSSPVLSPADDVTLRVTAADPFSLVGILVVDKAARLGGSPNDITEERVLKEMEEFNNSPSDEYPMMMEMGDPNSIFETCDLVALTDAKLPPTKYLQDEFPGEIMFQLDKPYGQQPEPHERQNFPETWVWMDVDTGDSSTAEVSLTVPDSITSWVASAFVMSDRLGLGVVQQPAVLTVFQDFFLSLNLPACIVRGEELVLEIVLYNYLQENLEVTVIVAWSDTFEFVFPENEGLAMPGVRRVSVEAESGATVLVPVRPLVLGEMLLSVKATSSAASDLVRRTVLVKAEGLEQSFSASLLLELSLSETSLSRDVHFSFPPDVVEGSERVTVTAVGDILGPSINGLDSLIQLPYGCGEQNMINFAPNIYVLQYLSATGQDNPDIRERAEGFMLKGYERELSFQRLDGSFSAFGESDASGSTWLSAFVLRCFLQARPFIGIDDHVLRSTAAWIVAQRGADGRFEEPGRVIHTELQGGLDGPVSLTAYVLIALLEDADIRAQYSSHISAALTFLELRLALGIPSNYSLGLVAYALARAGSPSAVIALSNLTGRAEMTDGVPMWPSGDAGLSASWQPRSAEIELASYVLLTQHQLGYVAEGLALMKWLSRQRNHRGGFGTTQDTITALQALSTFAVLGGSGELDVTIGVRDGASAEAASFHIHQENYLLHQSQQIEPEDELNLQVTAEGRGLALFQLNVFYNIRNDAPAKRRRRRRDVVDHEAFNVLLDLEDLEDHNEVLLHACTSLSEDAGLNVTGMAIMEVGLLSGFGLSPAGLQTSDVVKKVETAAGKVVLYLDSVEAIEEVCVTIPQVMEFKVAKVQDANVVVYDYYEPRRRTSSPYRSDRLRETPTCSLCGDDCSRCQGNDDVQLNAAAPGGLHLLLPLLLLLLFVFSL